MQVRVHVLGPVAKWWKMLISDEPSAWRCMMMMILLLFLLKQNLGGLLTNEKRDLIKN